MDRISVPTLKEVMVRVYGAGGFNEAHFEGVKNFWVNHYFKTSGARVELYSSMREVEK